MAGNKGKAGRTVHMNTGPGSGEMTRMAQEAGTAPKVLPDVSTLANGHLKMVGKKHDAHVGMLIPKALKDAWRDEAKEQGYSSATDCFEDVMLRWLGEHGWNLGKLDESEGGGE